MPNVDVDVSRVHTASQLTLLHRLGNDALRADVKARARELLGWPAEPRTLDDANITSQERLAAAARQEALPDGSLCARTVPELENVIGRVRAGEGGDAGKRHAVTRAVALKSTSLLPSGWLGAHGAASDGRQLEQPVDWARLLDRDALEVTGDRQAFAHMLSAVARTKGVSEAVALEEYVDTDKDARALLGSDLSADANLRRLGVDPVAITEGAHVGERFNEGLRMLEANATAGLGEDDLNARGQVKLAPDFNISEIRHSPQRREERLLRAQRHDRTYIQKPDLFAGDDDVHAFAGIDLVRSLERPAKLAAAREQLQAQRKALESAVRAPETSRDKLLALEAALVGEKPPAAPVAPARKRADGPAPRFIELSADEMGRALEIYEARTDRSVSLDACAAIAAGFDAPAAAKTVPTAPGDERLLLDAEIRAHQATHKGLSYLESLEALVVGATGI